MPSAEALLDRLERDARGLLADAGYAGVVLIRVDQEEILFTMDGRPFVAWVHERHIPRKQVGKVVGEIVTTNLHVESGWPCCESLYYEGEA